MGKQVNRAFKKQPQDVPENGHGMQSIPNNPIFSCGNFLLMVLTLIVAILVTALIVKATELQTLNEEKDATIDSLATETDELKQKLKANENSIENLNSKIKVVNTDKEDLDKLLENKESAITLLFTENKKSKESIKANLKDIEKLSIDMDKSDEQIDKMSQNIDSKNAIIESLNIKIKELNVNLSNLNEHIVEEKSQNSLLIDENKDINIRIARNIEKIKSLTKKEKERIFLISEKDAALSKSADKLKTKKKEFEETKKNLENESAKKDNEFSILKIDIDKKFADFNEEKSQLEKTISLNLDLSKEEIISLEKQHQTDLANVKLEGEKATQQLTGLLSVKEQDIVKKGSIINSLKEQNLQVSEDLAKYSEDIKTQISSIQKEKEKCEADSKEKELHLLSKFEKEEQNAKNILQEKEKMKNMLDSRYKMLEREKEDKVASLEKNRDQLLDNLDQEKIAKNGLADEKVQLYRKLEDSKLEISQLEDTMKLVQVDVGNCIVEKREDKGKLDNLENVLINLKKEKSYMESQCLDMSKELEILKTKHTKASNDEDSNLAGKESSQADIRDNNDE